MRSVGIKVLKDKLSAFVRAAEAGETVLVTDRDRVVAELVPPRRRHGSAEDILARGAREGWYTPPEAAYVAATLERHGLVSLEALMEDLARDREDR